MQSGIKNVSCMVPESQISYDFMVSTFKSDVFKPFFYYLAIMISKNRIDECLEIYRIQKDMFFLGTKIKTL